MKNTILRLISFSLIASLLMGMTLPVYATDAVGEAIDVLASEDTEIIIEDESNAANDEEIIEEFDMVSSDDELNTINENVEEADIEPKDNHEHTFGYVDITDECHTLVCTDESCDYEPFTDSHTFLDGICDCGQLEDSEKTEYKEVSSEINNIIISASGNMPGDAYLSISKVSIWDMQSLLDSDNSVPENVTVYEALDIKIMNGEEEYQPEDDTISINISNLNISADIENSEDFSLIVCHLDNDSNLDVLESSANSDFTAVSFETDGFSTFIIGGITYTDESYKDIDISAFEGYNYVLGCANVGDLNGSYRSLTTQYSSGADSMYDSNVVAVLLSNNDVDKSKMYYYWPSDTKMAIWLTGSGDMATLASNYNSGGYYSFWEAAFSISNMRYVTELFIDEGITSISAPNLSGLSEMTLPESLTRLNDDAFNGSSYISFKNSDYRLPESINYLGSDAISRSEGGLVTLPAGLIHCEDSSITWIGYYIVAKTLGGDEIGRYYKSTTYGNPCQFDESTLTYYTSVSKELLDTSLIDVSDYVYDHCGVENATLDLKLYPGCPVNEYVFYYSTKEDINITFLQEDGKTQIETLNLRRGDTITSPNEAVLTIPQKEGKRATFAGWKDVESHRVYGVSELENTLFYTDVTLKAYFTYEAEEKTYTVTFKDYDNSIISENTYHYGDTIAVPECTLKYYSEGWNYTFVRWSAPIMKTCTQNQIYTPVYSKTIDTFTVYIVDTDGIKYDKVSSRTMYFSANYGQTGAQIGRYFDTLKDITGGSYVCPQSFRSANGLSDPSSSGALDVIYAKWTKSCATYNPLKQYRLKGYTSSTDGFISLDKIMSHIFKNEQTLMPVFEEVNYTTGHFAKVYNIFMSDLSWNDVTLKDEDLLVTWYMGDDDYVILPLGNNGFNITETKYGYSPDPGCFFYKPTDSDYGGCCNTFLENVSTVGNLSLWGPTTSSDFYIAQRYSNDGTTLYDGYNLNLNYSINSLNSNNSFYTVENGHAYFPDDPEDYEISLPAYPLVESFNDNYGVHYTNQYKWIITDSYGLFEPFYADMNASSVTIGVDKWNEAMTHTMQVRYHQIGLQIQIRPYFTEAPVEYNVKLLGKDGALVLNRTFKHNDKLTLPTLSTQSDKFYSYMPLYWYNMNDIADIYYMDDEISVKKDLTLCMKYAAVPKDIINNFKVTLPTKLNLAKDSDNMLRTSFDIGISYEASIDETFIDIATPDFTLTSNKGASIPVAIKGRDKTKWFRKDLSNVSGDKYALTQSVILECDPKDMPVGEYEGTLKFIITSGIED